MSGLKFIDCNFVNWSKAFKCQVSISKSLKFKHTLFTFILAKQAKGIFIMSSFHSSNFEMLWGEFYI